MRFLIALLIACGLVAASAAALPSADGWATYVVAAQEPPAQLDIDVNTGGGEAWWSNPVWIAIGVVALIALIAIIVAASRGGGTTIVKE